MVTKLVVLCLDNVLYFGPFLDSNLRPHESGASALPLSYPAVSKIVEGLCWSCDVFIGSNFHVDLYPSLQLYFHLLLKLPY